MTDTLTFNVKDKSVNHFFEQHAIELGLDDARDIRGRNGISSYHLMKDELYLKKSSGIVENQTVIFELEDIASGSRSKLVNTYTYLSEKYDDVGIKLKLMDFKVAAIETPFEKLNQQ